MSQEIILYDLPTKPDPPTTWSLNPWKARLCLNYKNLPYRTQWTEYPDLEPTFRALGIPPNSMPPETAAYTSPAITLPDGSHLMESMAIAHALEKLQPQPSLHLDSPYLARVQGALGKVFKGGLGKILIPRVARLLLSDKSRPFFDRTRHERFGKSLEEVEAEGMAGDAGFKGAEEGFREFAEILAENADGPFVMGAVPSFADFIMVGLWRFVEMLDQGGELKGRIIGFDRRFGEQLEACRPWLAKDN